MKRPQGVFRDEQRGSWYFTLSAPGPRGSRQVRRRGFPTMEAARDARAAFRAQIVAGHVPVPATDTVSAFAASWISALPTEGVAPATVKHYSECLARVLPTVGAIRMQDLTALDLDRAYADLLDRGRAARTVRASHVGAKKMLSEAQRLGVVGVNVATMARPPRARAARAKTFPVWTASELARFLETVEESEHVALWTIAGYTGIRRGELCALQWSDVDLDRGTVHVGRSIGKGLHGALSEKAPKSDSGRRVVELDDVLVSALRAHRAQQRERRLLLGAGWVASGCVFTEPTGEAQHPDRVSKRWSDAVARVAPALGIPSIRFHDLRHSHCTQLLDAGVRPDVVSERAGHASVGFTLSTYAHRYVGDQRSGLARLRAAAQ
jgi:integrase